MASQAYDKALQLDKSNASAQTKLALVREIFTPTALDRAKAAKPAPVRTASTTSDTAARTSPNAAAKTSPDVAAVESTIRNWAAEWSQRDVAGYLSFYSPEFSPPDGMSRKDWENLRRQRITTPSRIRVDVSDFTIEQNGNRAVARFRERYDSNLLTVNVGKVLVLEQQGGSWKIVSEQ
jgi:ketosteroid isomerase-like protein